MRNFENKRFVALDSETALIKHNATPPIVCMTLWDSATEQYEIYGRNDYKSRLIDLLRDDSVVLLAHNAQFDLCVFAADDPNLLPLLNTKLAKGLVLCTKLAEILLNSGDALEAGDITGMRFLPSKVEGVKGGLATKNSLAGCVMQYLGIDLTKDKEGNLRTSYWDLRDIPVDQWSEEARAYAMRDAMYCCRVFQGQLARESRVSQVVNGFQVLSDLGRQTYVEFILGVMANISGIEVDTAKGLALSKSLVEEHDEVISDALQAGIFVEADKKIRGFSMSKAALTAYVQEVADLLSYEMPLTAKKTGISTTSQELEKLYEVLDNCADSERTVAGTPLNDDQLSRLSELHTILKSYQEAQGLWKEKGTFVDALNNARLNPDSKVRFKYNGLVETGRTSSSGPNLQNLPRDGEVRSCIVPGAGKLFIQADYSAAELRTLAQIHINEGRQSKLAMAYQQDADLDPHLAMALELMKVEGVFLSYAEGKAILKDKQAEHHKALKQKRQLSKAANFGLAGGLGALKFITYAAGMGTKLTLEEAKQLKRDWLNVWEEMREYFALRSVVTGLVGEMSIGEISRAVKQGDNRMYGSTYLFPVSKRARFLRNYTIASNTAFQGLAADAAKEALILIWEECFEECSPLHRCFPKLFIHDEFILTCPFPVDTPENRKRVTAAADRLSELMVIGFRKHCPDIPCIAEPCVSAVWSKAMESQRLEDGTLSIYGIDK